MLPERSAKRLPAFTTRGLTKKAAVQALRGVDPRAPEAGFVFQFHNLTLGLLSGSRRGTT